VAEDFLTFVQIVFLTVPMSQAVGLYLGTNFK